MKNITAVTV